VLAGLEHLGASTLVSSLVDEVNRQAAGEALLTVDATHHEHRKALVDAVLFLQDRGVLTLVDGDAEVWQRDGESDALFHVDLDAAGRVLIAWPSVLGASDDPALLLAEHHAPTDEGRAEAVRHRVHRRIVEQTVVRYDELDAEELAYVRQRRDRLAPQLTRLTGCTLEARAEGLALIDVGDRPLGGLRFPAGGTVAWAALLLGERLVEAVATGEGPERCLDAEAVAAAWTGVVDEYGTKFAKDWREDTAGLFRRCVDLLEDHRLVRPDIGGSGGSGGLWVCAPLARYRAEVRQREVQETLL
jgi:uncharacterized protein (TIGR02678 family)